MEPLDAAIASLRRVLETLGANVAVDLAGLWSAVSGIGDEQLITELQALLPTMVEPYVVAAADYTAQWYDDLAPGEPYVAAVPDAAGLIGGVIDPERMDASVSWAVHTGTAQSPAASRLAGSLNRMVHDASRKVVEHNAVRERVRYLRHAAPGACPWCRLMAIRGPVFKSAVNAIKGHDSCHCVAVPVRKGTKFVPPAHYAAWEKQYMDTTATLKAEGKAVSLANVLDTFRAADARRDL
jgi:hypothetical protein